MWLLRPQLHDPAALELALSPDERARAERFRLDADRRRYVVARGGLRRLLGGYLGAPPGDLAFEYSSLGRPSLASPHGADLAFSVAHSGAFALIAIGGGGPLGVDIEDLSIRRDLGRIAGAILAEDERSAWRRLSPEDGKVALLRYWTRREAVGKALGVGASLTAQAMERALAGPDPLTVTDLALVEGCVGAIAAGGAGLKVCLNLFEP